MPRITPVAGKDDVPAEFHGVVDQVVGVFGRVRGPFSVLLHSPKLAEHLLALVTFNREESVVEAPLRVLGVLAAVREAEAPYVWSAQVGLARRTGISEAAIDLLRTKGDPGGLTPDERDVIGFARQLMRTNRVDYAVFNRLKDRHGVQWLVELTAAIGYYAMLSGIVNVFEIAVPEDGDRLPD